MAEYITAEGMAHLKKRLKDLAEERPKVIEQVVTAREMGDLSENAEYHAARERQRHLENEMGRIQARMGRLKVIDTSTIAKDAIRFGAFVKLLNLTENSEVLYRLVGVDETYDREDGYLNLSVASPIGKAMTGKRIGNVFVVNVPAGSKKFKVMEIK